MFSLDRLNKQRFHTLGLFYFKFSVDRFLFYSGFRVDRFLFYSGFSVDRFHCIVYSRLKYYCLSMCFFLRWIKVHDSWLFLFWWCTNLTFFSLQDKIISTVDRYIVKVTCFTLSNFSLKFYQFTSFKDKLDIRKHLPTSLSIFDWSI